MDWPLFVAQHFVLHNAHALEADLVFAVWLNARKAHGLDFLLVKGEALLEEVERDHRDIDTIVITQVRVADKAEAKALRKKVRNGSNGGS